MDKVLLTLFRIWAKSTLFFRKCKAMRCQNTFQTKTLRTKTIIKAAKKETICNWSKIKTSSFAKTKTTESSFDSQSSSTRTNHSAESNQQISKCQKSFRREITMKAPPPNKGMTWETCLVWKNKRLSRIRSLINSLRDRRHTKILIPLRIKCSSN